MRNYLVATNQMQSHFVMNQDLLYPVLPRSRMVLQSMGAATLGANTLRPHQQQRILSCTRPTASRTVPPKLAQFSRYLFWEGLVKPNKSLKTSNWRLSSMHWFGVHPSCSHQPDAEPFCNESRLTLSCPSKVEDGLEEHGGSDVGGKHVEATPAAEDP